MTSRRLFALLALTFGLLTGPISAVAQESAAAPAPFAPAAWPTEPGPFVSAMADVTLNGILKSGVDGEAKIERFRTLFAETFDIPSIGKFVLGRNWRSATPGETATFTRLFEDVVVYTWARRFTEYYTDQTVRIDGVREDGPSGFVVETAIVPSGEGTPIVVHWRLRQREDGLKTVDVIVEGISMATTFRQEYASVIRNGGNQVSALIASLETQVADLKAGKDTASR